MFKILLADDEELERIYLKKLLNKCCNDYEVVGEAQNGREAIILAKKFLPDIIFMDIKMPGINGFEATREIKKFNPNVGVIILSAYNDLEYAQESLRIGAIEYLLKPATPEEIFTVLDLVKYQLKQNQKNRNLQALPPSCCKQHP